MVKRNTVIQSGESLTAIPDPDSIDIEGAHAAIVLDVTVLEGTSPNLTLVIREPQTRQIFASFSITEMGTQRNTLTDPDADEYPLVHGQFEIVWTLNSGSISALTFTMSAIQIL